MKTTALILASALIVSLSGAAPAPRGGSSGGGGGGGRSSSSGGGSFSSGGSSSSGRSSSSWGGGSFSSGRSSSSWGGGSSSPKTTGFGSGGGSSVTPSKNTGGGGFLGNLFGGGSKTTPPSNNNNPTIFRSTGTDNRDPVGATTGKGTGTGYGSNTLGTGNRDAVSGGGGGLGGFSSNLSGRGSKTSPPPSNNDPTVFRSNGIGNRDPVGASTGKGTGTGYGSNTLGNGNQDAASNGPSSGSGGAPRRVMVGSNGAPIYVHSSVGIYSNGRYTNYQDNTNRYDYEPSSIPSAAQYNHKDLPHHAVVFDAKINNQRPLGCPGVNSAAPGLFIVVPKKYGGFGDIPITPQTKLPICGNPVDVWARIDGQPVKSRAFIAGVADVSDDYVRLSQSVFEKLGFHDPPKAGNWFRQSVPVYWK
ncbi:MAG: hypothetical protein M1826_002007 [Phylliscum demangeonii]|nr:MAG: hypothetical protein M1826_002007 [Phylliscum demangeonii]